MSIFGDNTATQELYDWISYVKAERNLTWLQIVALLIKILAYIAEHNFNATAFDSRSK